MHVFLTLLLSVDSKTGSFTCGRYQMEALTGIKGSTYYKALGRLKFHKMVTQVSNNRYTTISICKWEEYQSSGNSQSNTSSNNKVTTKEQQSNTKQEVKNIRNKKVSSRTANAVQPYYDLYISLNNKNTNTYKLTGPRISKLHARLADAGDELLRRAIENTAKSEFHNGKNERGWKADLDWIIKSYEQVEKLSLMTPIEKPKVYF